MEREYKRVHPSAMIRYFPRIYNYILCLSSIINDVKMKLSFIEILIIFIRFQISSLSLGQKCVSTYSNGSYEM